MCIRDRFKGDTAIAFAHEEDPMSAARILCKYQDGDKSKKFVVKAGFMEGKAVSYTHLPCESFRVRHKSPSLREVASPQAMTEGVSVENSLSLAFARQLPQ